MYVFMYVCCPSNTDIFVALLQQALVGEGSGEEQLFSAEDSITKEGCGDELTSYIDRLKVICYPAQLYSI